MDQKFYRGSKLVLFYDCKLDIFQMNGILSRLKFLAGDCVC